MFYFQKGGVAVEFALGCAVFFMLALGLVHVSFWGLRLAELNTTAEAIASKLATCASLSGSRAAGVFNSAMTIAEFQEPIKTDVENLMKRVDPDYSIVANKELLSVTRYASPSCVSGLASAGQSGFCQVSVSINNYKIEGILPALPALTVSVTDILRRREAPVATGC